MRSFSSGGWCPPVDPPPRALFKSFFAPAPHSQPSLAFNWFARVQQALIDADSCLAAGHSDRAFLPARHSTYGFVVRISRMASGSCE